MVSLGTQGIIVVCISPLTAIMMDQRAKFTPMGLSIEFLGEHQQDPQAITKFLKRDIQLIYISPESILKNYKYRHMLLSDKYKKNLVAIAVDEAHCIHLEIGELQSFVFRKFQIIALTATYSKEILNTCQMSVTNS